MAVFGIDQPPSVVAASTRHSAPQRTFGTLRENQHNRLRAAYIFTSKHICTTPDREHERNKQSMGGGGVGI